MNILLGPLLTAGATEVVKWLAETIGPEWSALASKVVAVGMAAVLTSIGKMGFPFDLGPVLNPLQPIILAVVTAWGAQFIHDVTAAIAKLAGIAVPTPKLSLSI